MEETLGKRIAKNRKWLGLTQDRLAELLGVTAQAVSKWENDQSCPDINTLPKLARIFGITADELLGTPRAVETTVEPEEKPDDKAVEISINSSKKTSLGLAVWLILAGGVSLFLTSQNRNLPVWTVIWSSGLLTYGIFGLWRRISPFRLGCALAGGYFLAGAVFELPGLGWPVVLIVLGLLLLIRGLQKKPEHTFRFRPQDHVKVKGKREDFHMDGEHFNIETSFGENRHLVTLPKLSTGYAECSFGALTVDLTGCGEIQDGAEIELDCSFGELTLMVPDNCRLVHRISTSFGDCHVLGHPGANADRTIHVSGDVSFGEIAIRYL